MKKSETLLIGGVRFKRAKEILWQDAFKSIGVPVALFIKSLKKNQVEGIKQTVGWYARIGKAFVICNEIDGKCEQGDFTVIPNKSEIKVIQ